MRDVSVTLDPLIYDDEIVSRAVYPFTATCYVTISTTEGGKICVKVSPKSSSNDISDIPGELANALLEQKLRRSIARETQFVRELIIAQAFCEGDLLDRAEGEADPNDDPRQIVVSR